MTAIEKLRVGTLYIKIPLPPPAPLKMSSLRQISGTIDSRRLQTEDEPLAFPKIITSQLLFWIEQPAPEVTACEDLFPDNLSRCQCFFSIDQRTGGTSESKNDISGYRILHGHQ